MMRVCRYVLPIIFLQFSSILILLHVILHCNNSCHDEDTLQVAARTEKDSCESLRPNDDWKEENMDKQLLRRGSSVYCHGKTKRERVCKFKNLCYHSKWKRYIFFHGNGSVLSGIPANNRFDPAILDMTSVDDHNTQYFNFVDFPAASISTDFKDISFLKGPSLIFHRFIPENLMHVLHDDIIPVFLTLQMFFNEGITRQLVMMDGRAKGHWFELYEIFASTYVLLESNFTTELTCFNNAIVGLSKETTWYQYGFKVPQGRIKDHDVNPSHLESFVQYTRSYYGCTDSEKEYVVLVSRKQTRLILNQQEVSLLLANIYKKEVRFLNLEDQSLSDAICMMGKAMVLVGMHGAELILSLFLTPGQTLVELFPYGINPENYTPYKTLAALHNLKYIAWQNMKIGSTVGHPDRLSQFGGINHLPEQQRTEILEAVEVPKHLCCDNPYWLYRIYQDTIVDIVSLKKLLEESKTNLYIIAKDSKIFPDQVREPYCTVKFGANGTCMLELKWKPPLNEKFVHGLKYQVIIQRGRSDELSAYEIQETELNLDNQLTNFTYKLWIRCKSNGHFGPLSGTVICL
eukprot:Seg36.1 transcript_id=Seg36.1/GoldUCD/mRNA.D3Y31 product="Protein O-linked-mannose beta-1 4-N-acetylglucosaminyltransferase 2" protein_id=Seg36.1/GoldUCD/D3Y31